MQRYAAVIAIVSVIVYGIYNARAHTKPSHTKPINPNYIHHIQSHTSSHHAEEELNRLKTSEYTLHYIIDIINHGSQKLHFKQHEIMEEGFASAEDAPQIAAYVMQLRGESVDSSIVKNGAMFFTSICGGCHGNDGRGIHGTYPDLTRIPLLGIEIRKDELKQTISRH